MLVILQEEPVYLAFPQAGQTLSSTGNLVFQCLLSKPPNQASSLTYSIESNQKKQSLPRKTGTSPLAFVLTGSCNRRASKGSVSGDLPRQSGNVIKQNPAEHIPKPVCSVDPEELCPF